MADLRGKLAAISSELAEAEGELCAGRMAVEQLTRQVRQEGHYMQWTEMCICGDDLPRRKTVRCDL